MASKAVPGRGITLPFVEGLHGTPFYFKLNPYVTLYSCVLIWGFIVDTISMRWDAYKEFQTWFQWVTDEWTWLYIASQNLWIGVLLYILCSKCEDQARRAKRRAEFSRVQWFAMLYCCGVAVGLFYYGVAEPMWHFHGGGRRPAARRRSRRRREHDETSRPSRSVGWGGARWMDADMNDNEKANHALMVTYFHWGFHGWVPYVVIGALMSIMSYRRGLPLTMRSCFYPLWGKAIEGWRGDVVDVLSIVCTLFGVCTSLGLGVRQLNKGLVRLDRGTYAGEDIFGGQWGDDPPQRAGCSGEDCHKGASAFCST
ncbi:BCCT, betaine/carnitine/choline family transporter [Aureococcus anophagefferens]|nr:BCCT, betaine/carnitine/choline family transporter [Aureococcus anophagefferens]